MFKFETFCAELGRKHLELQAGTLCENKLRITPIFLQQFFNVLYLAVICAKFEKNVDSTSFSRELPERHLSLTRSSELRQGFDNS